MIQVVLKDKLKQVYNEITESRKGDHYYGF